MMWFWVSFFTILFHAKGTFEFDLTFECISGREFSVSFPSSDANLGPYSFVTLLTSSTTNCSQAAIPLTGTTIKSANITCGAGEIDPFETNLYAFHTESEGLQKSDTFVGLRCEFLSTVTGSVVIGAPPFQGTISDILDPTFTVTFRKFSVPVTTAYIGETLNVLVSLDAEFRDRYAIFLRQVKVGKLTDVGRHTVIDDGCPVNNEVSLRAEFGTPQNEAGLIFEAASELVTSFKAFMLITDGEPFFTQDEVVFTFVIDLCEVNDTFACLSSCDFFGGEDGLGEEEGGEEEIFFSKRRKRTDTTASGTPIEKEVKASLSIFYSEEEEDNYVEKILVSAGLSKDTTDTQVCIKKAASTLILVIPATGMVICMIATVYFSTHLHTNRKVPRRRDRTEMTPRSRPMMSLKRI